MNTKPRLPRPRTRRRRAAVALAVAAIATLALAGTASATTLWEDVWAQIRPLLADSGTINSPDNPVDWTKLKNVPAGFADGVDNGIDRAGFGLKKNIYPNLEFAVDTGKIQERVDGSCSAGQAVRSIAQDGTVTCSAGPRAFSTHNVDTGIICNDWCSEGSLELPQGSYAVTAKIGVRQWDRDHELFMTCRLQFDGSVIDDSEVRVDADAYARTVIPLQAVLANVGQGTLALVCRDYDIGDVHGEELVITAIRVS
jgi:hypothetical protein